MKLKMHTIVDFECGARHCNNIHPGRGGYSCKFTAFSDASDADDDDTAYCALYSTLRDRRRLHPDQDELPFHAYLRLPECIEESTETEEAK